MPFFSVPNSISCRVISTFVSQECVRDSPTIIYSSQNVVLGSARVIEKDFVEVVVAGGVNDWPDLNTWLIYGAQQKGNPGMFHSRWFGATQHKNPICIVPLRSPYFLAVNNPFVTVKFCSSG